MVQVSGDNMIKGPCNSGRQDAGPHYSRVEEYSSQSRSFWPLVSNGGHSPSSKGAGQVAARRNIVLKASISAFVRYAQTVAARQCNLTELAESLPGIDFGRPTDVRPISDECK